MYSPFYWQFKNSNQYKIIQGTKLHSRYVTALTYMQLVTHTFFIVSNRHLNLTTHLRTKNKQVIICPFIKHLFFSGVEHIFRHAGSNVIRAGENSKSNTERAYSSRGESSARIIWVRRRLTRHGNDKRESGAGLLHYVQENQYKFTKSRTQP